MRVVKNIVHQPYEVKGSSIFYAFSYYYDRAVDTGLIGEWPHYLFHFVNSLSITTQIKMRVVWKYTVLKNALSFHSVQLPVPTSLTTGYYLLVSMQSIDIFDIGLCMHCNYTRITFWIWKIWVLCSVLGEMQTDLKDSSNCARPS